MELSIIIPTHNERGSAPLLVYLISEVLLGTEYEIIVVDDGSTDGTADACREIVRARGVQAQILVRAEKHGLGNAYKRGAEHAQGKYVLILDADLSHDPREIPRFMQKAKETGADVVIGSRYTGEGGTCNWPFFRKLTSQGANILAHIFTGKASTDMTNSYRLYKRDVLACAINSVKAQGFAYQMEVLHHCGKRVQEIPIKFYERQAGCSKLSAREYAQFLVWGSALMASRCIKQACLFLHVD
ncbi:dolichol-phosphate mannosyltransferase [Nematocida major]|uniref:dolichol-phosphate mannosyltransferase n=1 Tax=Nematocida major TaxID=1912982 RepID=UPI002008A271|nr:dolichol-phosphate mannosyltransferase [Nematocida major]KAH9386355.1 dolichol-phosphate mannosyltransferase [Nematocida major]